jgi:diadenosine tetraphosphate (Ap4A) HIT family hydrolase
VPELPENFHARAVAAADEQGRLPVPEQAMWEIFPFERPGLVAKPLEAPVLPEPPRGGEDGRDCWRCAHPDEDVLWSDEHWLLARLPEPLRLPFAAMLMPKAHLDLGDLDDVHAGEMGQLIVRIDRAVRTLPAVGRVHVNKWGDGGAHLHVVFLARPGGLLQLRGSSLPLWEEMLPPVPPEIAAEDLYSVATALAECGGRLAAR